MQTIQGNFLAQCEEVKNEVEIREHCVRTARTLDRLYENYCKEHQTSPPLLLVAVLTGGMPFALDVLRYLYAVAPNLPVELDSIAISSYRDNVKGDTHLVTKFPNDDPTGKIVVLIDDISDTGDTLQYAYNMLATKGALEVWTAVLVKKEGERSFVPDIDGMPVSGYVFGYGMDYQGRYRNLPNIIRLKA